MTAYIINQLTVVYELYSQVIGSTCRNAASGFTRVHEGSQYTINRIFSGEHLNPTLKNIRISGKQMITRVHYAFERCLPEYERGFTRVYTRVYENPYVSFTIHQGFQTLNPKPLLQVYFTK